MRTPRKTLAALAATLLVVACSSSDDASAPTTTADPASITDASNQVDVRDLKIEPMPAGNGVPQRTAKAADARQPLPVDYVETEHLVSGSAAVYSGPATGPAEVASDGHPYATRVLVRAPARAEDFSGRVWLEPFNTSGGGEVDAIWSSLAPLIVQEGDAWVGITVRASQTARLQTFDPVRYAGVALTNNDHGWDAIRSIGTLVKLNPDSSPLASYDVEHVYLSGYSQSAVDAATFAGAFNGRTRLGDKSPVFDGYFLGSHESNLSPLQSGSTIIPKFESAPLPAVDVPVIDMESQTDVEGFAVQVPTALAREAGVAGADEATGDTIDYVNAGGASVRRDNRDRPKDHFWLLEIAGAPHGTGGGNGCDGFSSFPTSYFTRASAAMLVAWAEKGIRPPDAKRIELAKLDKVSVAKTDEHGNAVGGVRSPFVDVPLSRFEVHSGPAPTCKQVGNETPFTKEVLVKLYGDADSYLEAFTKSLDATIKARYLLPLDRQRILDAQRARANELFGG
jgi:hypothetical protein